GSSAANPPPTNPTVGSVGGDMGSVGVSSVGNKRARPVPSSDGAAEASAAGQSGSGSGGGGGGGGKRSKTGKEKVSLQEIMSQMRKNYAKKAGTPGAASKAVDAGARKAAADFTAARRP
ncbi:unnamed protein product, partial [Scytosiphon promiscuus]